MKRPVEKTAENEATAAAFYKEYLELKSVHKVGAKLGVCHDKVHRYLKSFGYKLKGQKFSPEEDALICDFYNENKDRSLDDFCLDDLVTILGGRSSKQNISRRAKQLGLTIRGRHLSDSMKQNSSERMISYYDNNDHPKGFLGGKHSEDTKKSISESSIKAWSEKTDEQITAMVRKQLKTRSANGTMVRPRARCSWKQQWAEINGVRKFYRSRWELNYAYYLEWMRVNGQIKSWEHEPETFWFDEVKRGCVSYLPDFKVVENNDSIAYHEVKGWMDDKSKTKIKRMEKYYPDVKLIVIDASAYKKLAKNLKGLVPGWA